MKYLFSILFFISILFINNPVQAEVLYLLPRLGLNISLAEDIKSNTFSSSDTFKNKADPTFAMSLAGGVHFNRVPLRLEIDGTFRTQTSYSSSKPSMAVNFDVFQITTMLTALYDIYLPSILLVPYVGVGVGFTTFISNANTLHNTERVKTSAYTSFDFSWQIVGGFSYPISSFLLEFTFRYVNLGDAKLSPRPIKVVSNLSAFDFLFGIRFPI
ncbi:MAG: outer membrane protein [Desulfovibrionaceae bacterium]